MTQGRDGQRATAAHERTSTRDVRVGRILNDYVDRKARGEPVDQADLLDRHPDLDNDLRAHFGLLSELGSPGDTVDALIAQGVLRESSDPAHLAELGTYKITGYLGRGGMGIVLKAYEASLNRNVALKLLRPELAGDTIALRRFAHEAKAAGALRHPSIVSVYAIGETGDRPFLSMEYVNGPTLGQLILARGPLPSYTARRLFRQLLSGLSVAHEAHLIHRDIKPSNLLLENVAEDAEQPEAALKVADFGLSRMLTAQTRMTMPASILGTPEYMSPEQARGDEQIDHRADLYSAGVVLYEMLTGRAPFRGDRPSTVIHQILHTEPPDPRSLQGNVDPGLASLAVRLMAKQPEDRFDSALEALDALDKGEKVRSIERRRRFSRRVAAVVAAVTLLTVAGWRGFQLTMRGDACAVTVDRVTHDLAGVVLARYGRSAEWEIFHDFGTGVACTRDPSLVDLDGDGDPDQVLVPISPAIGRDSVFAFDLRGKESWRLSVTPDSHANWPDFDGTPAEWTPRVIAVADLDGRPGDEVVIAARDPREYPTRVTVLDPRTKELRSTFFHTGSVDGLLIASDYFGRGKPAILAWGVNNKLDGYRDSFETAAPPRTEHEHVSVVFILDPANMDGLGPPHPAHPDLAHLGIAVPTAYAFLDLPSEFKRTAGGAMYDPSHTALITRVANTLHLAADAHPTGFEVAIGSLAAENAGRAGVLVDGDLGFLSAHTSRSERHLLDDGAWRARWRRIIQRGEYVQTD